jgi:hypothetical protein
MKQILYSSFCILLFGVATQFLADHYETQSSCFDAAFSAGYVFKNDDRFKDVYGHGMVNVITGDGCFYPWEHGGIGAKLSYWRATGKTTFLKFHSLLQEVPVTVYVRGRKNFECDVQLYGSLGAGFAWIQEKSYLGNVRFYKAIGELEVGFNYPICPCVNITTAVRYLFPPQSRLGERIDVGGFDLRAGIGFSF